VLSAHDRHSVAQLEATLIQAVRRTEELTAFVPRVTATDATDDGLTLRIRGPAAVVGGGA